MKEADKYDKGAGIELSNLLCKAKKFDLWANRALSVEMLGCASVSGISAADKHWDVTLLSLIFFYISKKVHFGLDEDNYYKIQYLQSVIGRKIE